VEELVSLLGGLAGSLHCIGMCGGFPLALGARGAATSQGGGSVSVALRGNVARQVLYNLGRLNTLAFLGALSGAMGGAIVALGPVSLLESLLALAAGGLMLLLGLEMLGVLGRFSARLASVVQGAMRRGLAATIASPSPLGPVALGVFNAFLPCQLVYAFAASAAATASPIAGARTMLLFGIGTVPAMLALGTSRSFFAPALRQRLSRASALLVVVFGLVTLARGLALLDPLHALLHAPHPSHVH
jgi:hypothetical protein